VHLVCDNILIANLTTAEPTPQEWYVVDGVTYDVIGYDGLYLQHKGGQG
jgi:hypothetical protein